VTTLFQRIRCWVLQPLTWAVWIRLTVVAGPPGWHAHQLTGDRAVTWSISVSGNWRITFDAVNCELCNLDLEDYH
jgi:plasmid maintenance system killer protein